MEIERGLEALLEEARYCTAQSYRRARHVKTVTETLLYRVVAPLALSSPTTVDSIILREPVVALAPLTVCTWGSHMVTYLIQHGARVLLEERCDPLYAHYRAKS